MSERVLALWTCNIERCAAEPGAEVLQLRGLSEPLCPGCGGEMTVSEYLVAEAERNGWRTEAWQCYVASGADPDGADARHLNSGEALQEVQDSRHQYDVLLDEAAQLEAELSELRKVTEGLVDLLERAWGFPDRPYPADGEMADPELWAEQEEWQAEGDRLDREIRTARSLARSVLEGEREENDKR